MNYLNSKKLGLATGLTATSFYMVCVIIMKTLGRDGTVNLFNNLIHGIDVSAIIRMDIPIWEAGLGIVETFILFWLIGFCIASFYNASIKKSKLK